MDWSALSTARKKVANRLRLGFRVGDRLRGRFATRADSPLDECSPFRALLSIVQGPVSVAPQDSQLFHRCKVAGRGVCTARACHTVGSRELERGAEREKRRGGSSCRSAERGPMQDAAMASPRSWTRGGARVGATRTRGTWRGAHPRRERAAASPPAGRCRCSAPAVTRSSLARPPRPLRSPPAAHPPIRNTEFSAAICRF
jgi:hypothetical protein